MPEDWKGKWMKKQCPESRKLRFRKEGTICRVGLCLGLKKENEGGYWVWQLENL